MSSSEQLDKSASIDRDIKVMSPPQGASGAQRMFLQDFADNVYQSE
jgi:hypothetical protein